MAGAQGTKWRMIFTLAWISGLSGLLLAGFFTWMNPIIEGRREQEVLELGLKGVFPSAATFQEITVQDLPDHIHPPVREVFDAGGRSLGYMVTATGQGWSTLRLAVGIDPNEQRLTGVRVLEHQETPGLGSRIEEASFLAQFEGKALSDPFQAGRDVDMITGATVSTRGVADTAVGAARTLLDRLGLDVPDAVPPATTASPVENAAAEPGYADRIRALAGEDVLVGPGDIWEVRDGSGRLQAIAVRLESPGFGGPVAILTLIDPQTRSVVGVQVLSHNETPGLGDEIAEDHFLRQFQGKTAADRFRVGADVDGITMATQSAQAVAEAVRRAVVVVEALYAGR